MPHHNSPAFSPFSPFSTTVLPMVAHSFLHLRHKPARATCNTASLLVAMNGRRTCTQYCPGMRSVGVAHAQDTHQAVQFAETRGLSSNTRRSKGQLCLLLPVWPRTGYYHSRLPNNRSNDTAPRFGRCDAITAGPGAF